MLNTEKVLTNANGPTIEGDFPKENNLLLAQPTEGWCCQHPKYWFLSPKQKLTETRTWRGKKITFTTPISSQTSNLAESPNSQHYDLHFAD